VILAKLTSRLIGQAEKRIGVTLDYTRQIAWTDFGLLMRYNRIFGFLDPNKHATAQAYHVARVRGAIAADCGTCVAAEINLAKTAGLSSEILDQVISGTYGSLPDDIAAVAKLADSVVGARADDPESRETIRRCFGEAGLIEISFAMNGAALLPGIKRAMGYAVGCDLEIARRIVRH